MKHLSKTLFILYVVILLWLVLFKFSYDIIPVLFDYQTRSLNWIPFIYSSKSEIISNFLVFIPFGLLLGVNFKRIVFWHKLAIVFLASLSVELFQYVFAIGVTDLTDLISNTLGGLLGLAAYALGHKYIDSKKLDRFIVIAGFILVILFVLLRVFIFKVRY